MITTSTLLDRNLYEVINFGVIAEDVNIDKTTQAIQTATGKYSQTFVLQPCKTRHIFCFSDRWLLIAA